MELFGWDGSLSECNVAAPYVNMCPQVLKAHVDSQKLDVSHLAGVCWM